MIHLKVGAPRFSCHTRLNETFTLKILPALLVLCRTQLAVPELTMGWMSGLLSVETGVNVGVFAPCGITQPRTGTLTTPVDGQRPLPV